MRAIDTELLTNATGEYARQLDSAVVETLGQDAIDATFNGITISDHGDYWSVVEAREESTRAALGEVDGYWFGSAEPGEIALRSVEETAGLSADQLDGMTTLKASLGEEGVTVTKRVVYMDATKGLMGAREEKPEDTDIDVIEAFLGLIGYVNAQ